MPHPHAQSPIPLGPTPLHTDVPHSAAQSPITLGPTPPHTDAPHSAAQSPISLGPTPPHTDVPHPHAQSPIPLGPTPLHTDTPQSAEQLVTRFSLPSFYTLQEALEYGQYNWFEVVENLEQHISGTVDTSIIQNHLEDFYRHVLSLPLSSTCKDLIKQSYSAYTISLPDIEQSNCCCFKVAQ